MPTLTRLIRLAKLARQEAESLGPGGRVSKRRGLKSRHGAIIFRGNSVITARPNTRKTNPKLCSYTKFPYVHAEQNAILAAGTDNTIGSSMLVIRIGADGSLRNSKPCVVCQQFIRDAGIRRVFFSTDTGFGELENDYEDIQLALPRVRISP